MNNELIDYINKTSKAIKSIQSLFVGMLNSKNLTENIDITSDILHSINKVNLMKELLSNRLYKQFTDTARDFILHDNSCYILSLLLIAHPRKDSSFTISYDNNYGLNYTIHSNNFFDIVNTNFQFLFNLPEINKDNKLEPNKEIIHFWQEHSIVKDYLSVFYRYYDSLGKSISLQLMPKPDFTFDIIDINNNKQILTFLSFVLKENEELKDRINISFRKYLGNHFSFL